MDMTRSLGLSLGLLVTKQKIGKLSLLRKTIVYDIVYDIVCLYRIRYRIHVRYRIRYHMQCRIRYRTSEVRYRTSKYRFLPYHRIRCRIRCRIRHRMFFLTISYVQRTISPKNVRCRTFLPVSCQSYVRCCIRCRTFLPVSCHFDVRHRIRYRTFFDDVAYDVQCNIGIIRYRT